MDQLLTRPFTPASFLLFGKAVEPICPTEPIPSEGAYEMKFTLPEAQVERLIDWTRANIPADPHAGPDGTYRIHSLYLDTPDLDVYHRSPSHRDSKYRVRRYGTESVLYLERKAKRKGWVQKQRTPVAEVELPRLGEETPDPSWSGSWYQHRIREMRLTPRSQVIYQRLACVGEAEGRPIRLTLDRHLRCIPASTLELWDPGEEGFSVPATILELKFKNALPAIFKRLVREFALTPTSASKYRRSVELCGLVEVATGA